MGKLKILVCTHNSAVKIRSEQFLPIQVGKALSELDLGVQGDDQGDNISEKNPNYCELTAMYWAWKNLEGYDYIGLCHYRRYFDFTPRFCNIRDLREVSIQQLPTLDIYIKNIDKIMLRYDIVLSKKLVFPASLIVHYSNAHYYDDYLVLKEVISELYPEYTPSFIKVFEHNDKLSAYNMFIMSKEHFENYCKWLFDLLFEVERRIDISNYNVFQARVFGFMGERLLNVYCCYNALKAKYYPIYFITDTPKEQTGACGNIVLLKNYIKRFKFSRIILRLFSKH